MSFLNFLSNVVIENVEPKAVRPTGKKQRNPSPEFLGFRIWADGSIFPSVGLVNRFNLEYPNADVTTIGGKTIFNVIGDPGMGMDVIDTRLWNQAANNALPFIAVAISPKSSPKLDLFGLKRYNDKGVPVVSVLDQGSATYGEKLLPLIAELYKTVPNEAGFIDMQVVTAADGGRNLSSTNGIELLPKVVSRGVDLGKADYVRRENVEIFILYPAPTEATLIDEPVTTEGQLDLFEEVEEEAVAAEMI